MMLSGLYFILLLHLIGLALGVGAATVKVSLLLKAKSDPGFVSTYLKVNRPITHVLISGLILLTISGIIWIILGTTFTNLFIIKLVLVLALWITGPIIDNVLEPRYKALAPSSADQVSEDFRHAQRRLLIVEIIATVDFYVITFLGIQL